MINLDLNMVELLGLQNSPNKYLTELHSQTSN